METQREVIEKLRDCQNQLKALADNFEKEDILRRTHQKPRTPFNSLMNDLGIDVSKWLPETVKMVEEKYSVKLKLNLK